MHMAVPAHTLARPCRLGSADACAPPCAFRQTRTPVYFAWIKHVSYVAYGYSGLVKNEFAGLRLTGARGVPVPDASSLIPVNIDNGLSIAEDALVMLGILVGMRVIAYFQMLFAIRHHWL